MIGLLVEALRGLGIDYGFFRLLDYLTFRAMVGMATSFTLSILLGHRVIVLLYRLGMRDTSGELASIEQFSKRGTPTAGGVGIHLATLAALFLWGDFHSPFLPPLVAGFAWLGLVGLLDDFLKVRFKSSLAGLGQAVKTLLLLAFCVPFAAYFVSGANPVPAELRTIVQVPFWKYPLFDAGPWLYGAFVVFVLFAIVNAVNITDGKDGLVASTSTLALGVYIVLAAVIGTPTLARYLLYPPIPGVGEVAVFGGALVGALLGFLWFNAYPAEVFMGDTGSLAVGGALGMMAFFTRQEMLFPIVGGIFVLEIFTSLVQEKLGYRLGRRLVLRAPFHYAVEHRGVGEPKLVVRFWIVAAMLALVGLISLKVR